MKNRFLKKVLIVSAPSLGFFIYFHAVDAENEILKVGGTVAALGLTSLGISLAFYPDESQAEYWREQAHSHLHERINAQEQFQRERHNLLLKLNSLEKRVTEAEADNQEILERIGVPSNYLHLMEIVEKN